MRGYTLQEFMIVLLLGALIAAVGIPIAREAYNDLEDADFAKLLEQIVQTSRSNYEQSTSYSGLGTAEIIPNLPQKWVLSGAQIRHPLNGTIAVSADATDSTRMSLVVTVQRPDTCRRAILSAWPLIDAISVSTTATGASPTSVKTGAAQNLPSETTLATACTVTTQSVVLLSD